MSGILLATYLALWVIVCFQTILILVLFRQLGIMVMGTARGANESGIPVGRRLPELSLQTLDGQPWSPAQHDGEASLLFFGGYYCEGCKDVLPYLEEIRDAGVPVATLLLGDREKSRDYAREFRIGAPVVGIDDEISAKLDVEVTPFAYAIDEAGVVRGKGLANHRDRLYDIVGRVAQIDEDIPSRGDRTENDAAAALVVQQRNGERP